MSQSYPLHAPHAAPRERGAALSPLRIIIVEDDAMIGVLLAEMLVDMGHLVCAIEDTEAGAVRAALRHRPDLLIVDANLREGSGVAAVARILTAGPVAHLFISGADFPGSQASAVRLLKPFLENDLVRAIERARAVRVPG